MVNLGESWLELEKAMGGRAVLRGGPQEMRAQYDGLVQLLLPHYPAPSENVESKDGDVDGIKYRIYTPKSNKGGLPIGIWSKWIMCLQQRRGQGADA